MSSLADELLMIALDDVTGRNRATGLEQGLAGALLLELSLAGRIGLDGRYVSVVDARPIGEVFSDEALVGIGADKARTPRAWVDRLARKLLPRVRERLVASGVLREEKHRFLGVVPYRQFPADNATAELDARGRLARAAANGVAEDARTAALAGLVMATRLYKVALPELSGGDAKRAVRAVADRGWATEATGKAIEAAITAAVTAAVIASVAATSAGGSGG